MIVETVVDVLKAAALLVLLYFLTCLTFSHPFLRKFLRKCVEKLSTRFAEANLLILSLTAFASPMLTYVLIKEGLDKDLKRSVDVVLTVSFILPFINLFEFIKFGLIASLAILTFNLYVLYVLTALFRIAVRFTICHIVYKVLKKFVKTVPTISITVDEGVGDPVRHALRKTFEFCRSTLITFVVLSIALILLSEYVLIPCLSNVLPLDPTLLTVLISGCSGNILVVLEVVNQLVLDNVLTVEKAIQYIWLSWLVVSPALHLRRSLPLHVSLFGWRTGLLLLLLCEGSAAVSTYVTYVLTLLTLG